MNFWLGLKFSNIFAWNSNLQWLSHSCLIHSNRQQNRMARISLNWFHISNLFSSLLYMRLEHFLQQTKTIFFMLSRQPLLANPWNVSFYRWKLIQTNYQRWMSFPWLELCNSESVRHTKIPYLETTGKL